LSHLWLLKSIKPQGVFIVYQKLLFIRGEMLEIDQKTLEKRLANLFLWLGGAEGENACV